MKRLLSVFLAVLMCVLPLAANASAVEVPSTAKAVYTFSNDEGYPGEDVEITLSLKTLAAFKAGGVANITYEKDALTFNGGTIESAFGNLMFMKDFRDMTLVAASVSEIASFNDKILTLSFTIKEDAEIGEYEIKGVPSISNESTMEAYLVPGKVTVKGLDFPAMTFKGKTVEYNSEVQNILVSGAPDFANVAYTVNGEEFDGAEDAGTYDIVATVTAPGYNKKVLEATLEIEKKDLVVDLADIPSKVYDGTDTIENFASYITVDGIIDGDNVSVDYDNVNGKYLSPTAGTWTIVGNIGVRGGDLPNYNLVEDWKEATATITPKPITVKADDVTVKAGAPMPEFTYTADGLVEGDELKGITLSTRATNTNTVKKYDIIVKSDKNYDKNYQITTKNGIFEVVAKTVQQVNVPEAQNATYGDPDFNLGVTLGETVNASAVEYESLTPSVVSVDAEGNVTILGAGSAKIAVTKAGDADYADFSKTVTFTVAKKGLIVTAKDVTVMKTVGTIPAKADLEYDVEGLVNGDTKADVFTGTLTTTATNSNTVKEYPITQGTLKANANYVIDLFNKGTLYVVNKTKQDITVTSNAPSTITYGDEGFKIDIAYGETVTDAETVIKSDNEAVATVDAQGNVTVVGAGEATITVSKAGNDTIADFAEEIDIEVAKKPITIAAKNASKKVGAQDPVLSYDFDRSQLVGNDTISGNVTRAEGEEVGEYVIGPGTLSLTNTNNYDVNFISATFTIFDKTPQEISVTPAYSKTYGDDGFKLDVEYGETVTDAETTFVSNNEAVVTVDAEGNVTIVGAGTAKITVAREGNEDLANFSEVVRVNVAQRTIKVKANDIEVYVDQTPVLTFTYEGELVGYDDFEGELYVNNGNVGGRRYSIKIGSLTLGNNYDIDFEAGTLYVLKKLDQFAVSHKAIEAEYGKAGSEIGFAEAEKYNSEAEIVFASSNTDVATVDETGYVTFVGAGKTTITVTIPGNYKFNDYEHSYVLTIRPKPITVTAVDASKKIGAEDPKLEYIVTGSLVGDDAFTGALARKAGETVGTYAINIGTLALNDNYKITFVPGTFTIFDKTPQDITVTTAYEKTYGDEAFELDVTYGETVADNTTTFLSNNEAVATVDEDGLVTIVGAGTAKITVARLGNEDLADFAKTVVVTVAKREIKVIADPQEKYVGQATPELTYTVKGELVGDDEFTGALTVTDGNKAGRKYDIKIGTLALNDNYKVTFVGAKLSVLAKVDQDITFIAPEETMYGVVTLTWYVNLGEEVYEDGVLTVTSSNEDVVVLEDYAGRENGCIVIKSVGKTVLTAKYTGNEKYNDWEDSITLVVKKCPYIVTVEDKVKKIGNADPEYTFSLETHEYGPGGENLENGTLGVTITREEGEELGKYDITAVVDVDTALYDVKVNKGTLTIIDKLPSTVVTEAEIEKTYGDVYFEIEAEVAEIELPGEGFSLPFRYSSDNENVVMFPEEDEGTAIIVGAGTATVTVYYDGDNEYAASSAEIAVTVLPKEVAIEELDVVNKTVVFEGMIAADAGMLSVDFNKLTFVPENVQEGQTPENYVVTGFELTGDKSANYILTTESLLVPISEEIVLVNVSALAENGTVEGTGSYLAGSTVTLKAVPNKNYKFTGWFVGEEKVSADAEYTFIAEADVEFTATFKKNSTGSISVGGSVTRIVYFEIDDKTTNKVIVDKGDKVERPEDPELEGFVFGGWFTDKDFTEEYDFDKSVEASLTLYAKWTEVEKPDDGEDKPEEWKNPYADVDENDWYYEVVKAATMAGIMNGVSDDTFAPDMLVTRAMVVTMLYRAEENPVAINEVSFEDLEDNAYYTDAVAWANENGIVLGYSETEFAPNDNVTREQIAAIIFRYALYKGVEAIELSENLFFDDADKISEYAVAPMNWLVGKEIITGYEDGTIRPQGNATRAEVAAITARILAFFAQ